MGRDCRTNRRRGVMFTEAVNGLCASLLCDDRLSRGAVLMVTSASENEGKTLLATQLAAGLARTGRRTLLLDGDLRNSRCREQLGLADGPGLSEVLRVTKPSWKPRSRTCRKAKPAS